MKPEGRAQALARLVAAGGGQRGQGAPVPGRVHGDDVGVAVAVPVGVVARQLDGGFVGLGAAVVEDHVAHAGQPRQARGQLGLLRDFVDIGGVDDARGLLADGRDQPGMGVAQTGDADARQRVQVLAALRVPQPDTLAVGERYRQPGIDVGQRRGHRGSSWAFPWADRLSGQGKGSIIYNSRRGAQFDHADDPAS